MTPSAPGRPECTGTIALVDAGPVRLVRFIGDIGRDAVREFRLGVRPSAWPARVDLSAVRSLDAAGRELLLHLARKQRRSGGELEVVAPPAAVRRTMERSGLTSVLRWAATDAPPPAPPLGTAASA
jgi:anti-anti-sigma factor